MRLFAASIDVMFAFRVLMERTIEKVGVRCVFVDHQLLRVAMVLHEDVCVGKDGGAGHL